MTSRIADLIKEVKQKVELHLWASDKLQKSAQAHAEAETAKRNSFPLRPSSALKSMRDLYYGLVNYYNPGTIYTDPVTNPILLEFGHTVERHLVSHLERAFTIRHRNQRVEYGAVLSKTGSTVLSGELDFCIITETGETVICDSKSCAAFPFEKGLLPKEEHIAQINLYMHSKWARDLNITRAIIIYYNKNNSQMKFYEFQYSAALAVATIARFQEVHNMYEAGTIPNREHVYGQDWQCNYSSYKTHDLKDFSVPLNERPIFSASNALAELSSKEIIKYICCHFGNAIVDDYYLELGASGLLLKKLKQGNISEEGIKKYGT